MGMTWDDYLSKIYQGTRIKVTHSYEDPSREGKRGTVVSVGGGRLLVESSSREKFPVNVSTDSFHPC